MLQVASQWATDDGGDPPAEKVCVEHDLGAAHRAAYVEEQDVNDFQRSVCRKDK